MTIPIEDITKEFAEREDILKLHQQRTQAMRKLLDRVLSMEEDMPRIVVKTESTRGRKVKEIYQFSEDGTQLHVTVETEGGGRMPSFTFRRVYDRAETG